MKTKYLAFAAAAFMLASCSNDEDSGPQDDLKDTPITVTAGVEGILTRAGCDDDNLPTSFYMTIIQDEANQSSKYNYDNVVLTKGTGNDYAPATTLLWNDDTRSPFVSAYNAYRSTFDVWRNQSSVEGVISSDLLGAVKKSGETSGDITITEDNIDISFRHLLCKLDVTYSWGTEFDNIENKRITSVRFKNMGVQVSLNRGNGTVEGGGIIESITAYLNGETSEVIFAPYVSEPTIDIAASINGETRNFSLNITVPEGGFESGKRYTMDVIIGATPVEDRSVTATVADGWDDIIGDDMATD